MNRRQSLQLLSALPALGIKTKLPNLAPSKSRLRVAHITDTHIKHDKNAVAHTKACLQRIMALQDKPDLIIHSGDVIFDALTSDKNSITDQMKAWHEAADGLNIPIKFCIGNHDVWNAKGFEQDPSFGKKWIIDELKMPGRYYTFEQGGWTFVVLDSVQIIPDGKYIAAIDQEQFTWLSNTLASIPAAKPVMIISHIPIVSVSVFEFAELKNNTWEIGDSLLHSDTHELQALFRKHTNVKICISGHLHLLDIMKYDNITYCGTGAICGNWWDGDTFHQTVAGFALMDLFDDGTFDREYVQYGWA